MYVAQALALSIATITPHGTLPRLVENVAQRAYPGLVATRTRAHWRTRAWLALLDAPPDTLLNQETKDTLIRTLIHTAQHVDASEQPSFLRILCTWIGTRPHEHAQQVCADADAVAQLVQRRNDTHDAVHARRTTYAVAAHKRPI